MRRAWKRAFTGAVILLVPALATSQAVGVKDYRAAEPPTLRYELAECSKTFGGNGENRLRAVAAAFMLNHSAVLVVDAGARLVSVFSRDGTRQGEFGSSVAAPIPFAAMYGNDTAVIYDRMSGRLSLVTPVGIARTFVAKGTWREHRSWAPLGVLRSGVVVLVESGASWSTRRPGVYRDTIRLHGFDSMGDRVWSVTELGPQMIANSSATASREAKVTRTTSLLSEYVTGPAFWSNTLAMGPDAIFSLDPVAGELRILGSNALLRSRVLLPANRLPDAGAQPTLRRGSQNLEVHVDRVGRLWLEVPRNKATKRQWLVLDRSGTWIASGETSTEGRILELGDTYMLRLRSRGENSQTVDLCDIRQQNLNR